MSAIGSLLGVRVLPLLLLAVGALEHDGSAGLESVEIKAHRIMRRHSGRDVHEASVGTSAWELDAEAEVHQVPGKSGKSSVRESAPTPLNADVSESSDTPWVSVEKPPVQQDDDPTKAADVTWGSYKFNYANGTQQCTEEGVNTWEGKSFFEAWSGTDTGLSITNGTTVLEGVVKETSKGLRIYKAACSNTTAIKVGGVMQIPELATSIEIVFGLTQRCTGDCAPFMVTVSDAATDRVKHRWCWNREGDAPEMKCDVIHYVPYEKWQSVQLDITNFTDTVSPLKLALEVYTSGDFRLLPALPGQVGIGGRAMVLVDSLIFGPSEQAKPDSTFKGRSLRCRQSLREVCKMNSWCMDKYRCYSGMCAEGGARCNGERNCDDDSDEVGCEQEMGFRGEFFLNHVHALSQPDVDVDSLEHPDLRVLQEDLDYDAEAFWKKLHVRDMFAAKWMGNFTITKKGHYNFEFPHNGSAQLRLQGLGEHSNFRLNVSHNSWTKMPAGKFQLTLTYVNLKGKPSINLKYAGKDTRGAGKKIPRKIVTATMTGSHCDTMHCASAESLAAKPGFEKILCGSVPCRQSVDTRTCCSREYKAVACGDHRTCALDMRGRPVCWGSWEGFNEEWKNHRGPYVDISTRGDFICAVKDQDASGIGMVECWGPDSNSTPSVDYSAGGMFTNVTVGGQHTCALRDGGFPACTGSHQDGQINPPSQTMFSRVAAGNSFTCGIETKHHSVKCWGANERGQATPPKDSGHFPFTHLGAGESHACGISNGSAVCWGWNSDGQATPPKAYDFVQVAPGGRHTCALKANGHAVCWGSNAEGQTDPVEGDAPYLTISSGKSHSCAIRARDNEIVCWGSNHEQEASADGKTSKRVWRGQSEPPPAGIWP